MTLDEDAYRAIDVLAPVAGGWAGAYLRPVDAATRGGGLLVMRSPDGFVEVQSPIRTNADGSSADSDVLPAGEYRLYAITSAGPVSVRLRLPGLGAGETVISPDAPALQQVAPLTGSGPAEPMQAEFAAQRTLAHQGLLAASYATDGIQAGRAFDVCFESPATTDANATGATVRGGSSTCVADVFVVSAVGFSVSGLMPEAVAGDWRAVVRTTGLAAMSTAPAASGLWVDLDVPALAANSPAASSTPAHAKTSRAKTARSRAKSKRKNRRHRRAARSR